MPEAQRYYESVMDAWYGTDKQDSYLASMSAFMVTRGIHPGAFDENPSIESYSW